MARPRKNGKLIVNRPGVIAILSHEPGVVQMVEHVAEKIATEISASGYDGMDGPITAEIETGQSTWPGGITPGDRFAAQIIIKDGKALQIEAKYGVIKKAATGAGAEWGRKSQRGAR